MWHAFDIIADELAVDPAVRGLAAGPGHRLVYSERVVRWFSDKTGQGQWPAVVDRQPGITLERPGKATENTAWELIVQHTRPDRAGHDATDDDLWIQSLSAALKWNATESVGDLKRTRR
ncbi:MAG: hypothetical protein R3C45_12605 [Phycisphaerales bacterium]